MDINDLYPSKKKDLNIISNKPQNNITNSK